jgi:hypothetical protein
MTAQGDVGRPFCAGYAPTRKLGPAYRMRFTDAFAAIGIAAHEA